MMFAFLVTEFKLSHTFKMSISHLSECNLNNALWLTVPICL